MVKWINEIASSRQRTDTKNFFRQHARNFDAGQAPSSGGVQRVLTELRRLVERMASPRGL